jgi:DNA-binding PadR family transcriptional regulator
MEQRSKRTYRISARTQARVRELASRYGVAGSQDAVVEAAIDRLYREVEAQAEAERWSEAAADEAFRDEAAQIARAFAAAEAWPE